MKKLAIAAVVLSTIGGAQAAELGDTGTPIRLAINEWTGQHLTTQIAGQILEEAGYTVEYVTAGYMNMYQAMADGEIHAALEVWESNVSDQYYDQLEAGGVVEVSDLGLTAREGFVYPAHVAEICPGLPAWEALNDCAMQFATAETIPQGRLVDYPADWGTPGADRVAGLELPYRAVPAGSEGALIAELRAFARKAHVTGQHQFDPAGQTQPLHRHHDREGGRFERAQVLHAEGDEVVQRGGIIQFTFHFI